MPEWTIAILSALAALLLKETYEWLICPRFEVDFEEKGGQKPYIPDYNDDTSHAASEYTYRIKYLRLIVRNKGRKPAMGCEAKLELLPDSIQDAINKVALHWSRNDPALYSKYEGGIRVSQDKEKIFAPISLNKYDEETVDIFQLDYHFSTKPETDHSLKNKPFIETVSPRQLILQPSSVYIGKVTIYANNANPKSFEFEVYWDGTVEGFNKAFTKK